VWYALDFEYAASGDPLFDLAAVIEGDGLDRAATEQLLEGYQRVSPLSIRMRQDLQTSRALYRYTTHLWRSAEIALTETRAPGGDGG
jgi:thiamine kinase